MKELLDKDTLSREDIVRLLAAEGEDKKALFEKAAAVKKGLVGSTVYFRGLIEISNVCKKDCLYCGIRRSNTNVHRYTLSDDEILKAVDFAYENNYGSVVMQSGEVSNKSFTERITRLLREIKKRTNQKVGITLSLGEQSRETYQQWFDAGAHRYLLRIESSNPELYKQIHPENSIHTFEKRVQALHDLKATGYQTGTGVMIGLPGQTLDDLAGDLLFLKNFDIDMVGMGPYIEHEDTPLFAKKEALLPLSKRFELSLKMIAILRIVMPDINIAATTALQSIDKLGREKALKVGANIMMPNITPGVYRDDYLLYQNKPCTQDSADDCRNCLEARIHLAGHDIGWGQWGDSKHFAKRKR
ncbi:MAG: [FeFe] hydrogenase H-cluster radical SAM maturase HydE [Mariniphaga sp.]